MNLYALNTAPINGWETHLGSGQAAMSLAASGASANTDLGTGAAQLALSASGSGTRRVPASGSASMQIQAAGSGTRWVLGTGTASMQMAAAGNGEVSNGMGGKVSLVLHASGTGGILVNGSGVAQMQMGASGEARTADAHYGTGHCIMESRAWDIPKSYSTHHGSGAAGMRLAAAGTGTIIAKNGGTAAMQIQAQGSGRIGARVHGEGAAVMRLIASRVESSQHRQINGDGVATMAIKASARDNRVIMLPSSFSPAPKARGLRVATENRAMRVPRQPVAHQLAEA